MTQRDTDPPENGDPLDQQLQSQPYYPAAVRPPAAQASTWHGEVPDLPGCVVAGVTLEDTMVRLVEAMQATLADIERRTAAVPEPSSFAPGASEVAFITSVTRLSIWPVMITTSLGRSVPRWMATALQTLVGLGTRRPVTVSQV